MNPTDYYAILGISPNASMLEIRKAYRRLALQYHPDRNKDPGTDQWMQLINEAYAVLGNPARRAQYEFWRRYNTQAATPSRNARPRTAAAYPQIGPDPFQAVPENHLGREAFERLDLFIGQIIYQLIYDLLIGFLSLVVMMIPGFLYFMITGLFFAWIGPWILFSSDDSLAATGISTVVLTLITVYKLRKQPRFAKFFRMLGSYSQSSALQ